MKKFQDERTSNEVNKIYASLYWLILLLSGIVGAIMFAIDRTFAIFIPIITAVAGSVTFLVARYAFAGILFSRDTDERIEIYKINTKAYCFYFCFAVYILSGAAAMFVFPDNPAATDIFFIWIIPTSIAVFRTTKKGVGNTGFSTKDKKSKRILIAMTVVGALIYGVLMTLLHFEVQGIFPNIATILVQAILFGIPWYFLMRLVDKRAEKNAEKHLEAAEKETGDNQ
jgi:preprotein translocase subunit YajC